MPRSAAALLFAVIAAACSTSLPASAEHESIHTTDVSPSASTGKPHTGHTASGDGASGTPHPSAPEGADGTIVLPSELAVGGSGVSVAEALDVASGQPVLVNGVVLRDANGGIWFCDQLGEGEAPACGRPRLAVTNFPVDDSVFEPENARGTGSQTEGGVTWIPNQQLYGVVHPAP